MLNRYLIYLFTIIFEKKIYLSTKIKIMKKTVFLLSILISLSGSQIFAQINTINFSDYKLPDLKRQTFDFSYNLQNFYNNINYTDSSVAKNQNSNFNLINVFTPRYTYYKNTRKYQGYQYGRLKINNNLSSIKILSDSSSNTQRTNLFTNSFRINSSNRFYFKEKYFWGAGLDLEINHMSDIKKTFSDNDNVKNINNSFQTQVSLPLSIGKGRIEPVTDYVHSIYIINNLEKEGRLERNLKTGELIKLTELISEVKNERFFDSRLKKIYELEKIDSFLNTNNLISDKDAVYFTTLYDNWEFAGNQYRYSGNRIYFYVSPQYTGGNYLSSNETDTIYNKNRRILLETGVNFSVYKNLNLFWQRHFDINIGTSAMEYLTYSDSINFHQRGKKIYTTINYGYKWYPNTRTNFNFYFSPAYAYTLYDTVFPENGKSGDHNFTLNLNISGYYYFSPRLRFSINFYPQYNYYSSSKNLSKNKQLDYNLFAGFQYSLF